MPGRSHAGALSPVEVLRILVVPAQRRPMLARLREAVRQACMIDCDVAIRGERVLHVEAEPQFDEQGRLAATAASCRTSPSAARTEDKIRVLANFDSLTELPNRRQLIWRAEHGAGDARSAWTTPSRCC